MLLASCTEEKGGEKFNVLFIAVDDLRPELNSYGASHIKSPNIDRLANEGLTFTRAYCNVPVCGASRASLMTGIKPTKNRFIGYDTFAEKDAPGAISLPQHFKNNGYHTISNGKIFHHLNDMASSWSEPAWRPDADNDNWRNYLSEENIAISDTSANGRALPYEWPDVEDEAYFDGQIARKTIEDLRKLKDAGKPFFIAAGFLKPHLPFNAPKKYWDLYPEADISLPDNYFVPENAPAAAIHNFGELRNYSTVPPRGPVTDEMAKNLIRGYYACVSYTDAQIGHLLQALDDLDLRKNTIVILWGDHGWQLGEHTLWCKHSNFDVAMKVPMIISAPDFPKSKKTSALAEYIDIYPTLCELTGLNLPEQLQGKSFVHLMKAPEGTHKEIIYSRYVNGESIKTDRYLYSEWYDKENTFYGRMLYDHFTDPDENVNISELPENRHLVDSLSTILHNEMEKAFEVKLPEVNSQL
jgi:arylsulfatase A-like enzyme